MPPAAERFAFGDFVLERSQRRVLRRDGTELSLAPRLFDALLLFVERAGELLEKDELMRSLWRGLVVEENNLSQMVSGLRRALGDDAHGSRFIQTVPRRGFRFIAPVTALPPTPSSAVDLSKQGVGGDSREADLEVPVPADPSGRRRWLGSALALGAMAAAAIWWMRRRAPPAPVVGPTLAVLPFKPLNLEGRDTLLEMGMADSLITRLSTVPGLVVVSSSSVGRYAGAAQDPFVAARELGVTWIVDGSVQRSKDQLRVSARLLHAKDGRAAWSGSFDERFTDVFAVQDQISSRVVRALESALGVSAGTADLAPIVEPGGTRSTDAYQLYLAAWRRLDSGRVQESVELFRQALAIDPNYANAWLGLSIAYRHRLWNADAMPSEVFDQTKEALRTALDVAPGLVQARTAVATTRYFYDFDWPGAEREFRSVLATNPNVANAHRDLAIMLLTQGRAPEGFDHMRRARELDPGSPLVNTLEASFLTDGGRLGEAKTRLDRAFDFAPDLWLAHVALGQWYFAQQQPEKGIASLRRAVQSTDATTRPKGVLGRHLAMTGRTDEARELLGELLRRSETRFVPPTTLAMVYAALGDAGSALDRMEQALIVRDTRLIFARSDPSWKSLQAETRFLTLLRTLKLDQHGPGLTPV